MTGFNNSIPLQRLVIRQQAERKGWHLDVTEYVDIGPTSQLGPEGQPAIQTALQDATQGEYDVLVVRSWDRLTRYKSVLDRLLADLKAAGVTVHTATESEYGTEHFPLLSQHEVN